MSDKEEKEEIKEMTKAYVFNYINECMDGIIAGIKEAQRVGISEEDVRELIEEIIDELSEFTFRLGMGEWG